MDCRQSKIKFQRNHNCCTGLEGAGLGSQDVTASLAEFPERWFEKDAIKSVMELQMERAGSEKPTGMAPSCQ